MLWPTQVDCFTYHDLIFLFRLSAIALQTLEDADEADWRDNGLFIPVELRNRIALWLTKQQDNITGAFWDRAPLYDRKMKVRADLYFIQMLQLMLICMHFVLQYWCNILRTTLLIDFQLNWKHSIEAY